MHQHPHENAAGGNVAVREKHKPKRLCVQFADVESAGIEPLPTKIESERRYVLKELPPGFDTKTCRCAVINQGFFDADMGEGLPEDGRYLKMRVREQWEVDKGSTYELNSKTYLDGNNGDSDRTNRKEIPYKIRTKDGYKKLWDYTVGEHNQQFRLKKVRFYYEYQGDVLEIDVFLEPPRIKGAVITEIEFDSAQLAAAFDPATRLWLGQEVTKEKSLGNSSLASHGKLPKEYKSLRDDAQDSFPELIERAKEVLAAYYEAHPEESPVVRMRPIVVVQQMENEVGQSAGV